MSGPHPISGRSEYKKRADPPASNGNYTYLTASSLDISFSCLQTRTETLALPGSQACQLLDRNYTIGPPRSPACWLEILGIGQPP